MRWIWIDTFVDFEPRSRAVAVKNVSSAEDYLYHQSPGYPVMPHTLIVEGVAQTAGVLVGQAREFSERVILAKVQKAEFQGLAVPGDRLTYDTTLERIDDLGASTSGRVLKNEQPFGQVDMVFSHLERRAAGELGIPQHNFVFGEDFRTLLASFGVDLTGYPKTS